MKLLKSISIATNDESCDLKNIRKKYGLRRADRYTLLFVAALDKIIEDIPTQELAELMIITVTSFGPHQTTFAFLDDILDYPQDQVLPQKFSHSVHNAAPAYLSMILKSHGAIYAFSGFENVWSDAEAFAQSAITVGDSRLVLIIGGDEIVRLTENLEEQLPDIFTEKRTEILTAKLFARR